MREHEVAYIQGGVTVPVDRPWAGPGAAVLRTVAITVVQARVASVASAEIIDE